MFLFCAFHIHCYHRCRLYSIDLHKKTKFIFVSWFGLCSRGLSCPRTNNSQQTECSDGTLHFRYFIISCSHTTNCNSVFMWAEEAFNLGRYQEKNNHSKTFQGCWSLAEDRTATRCLNEVKSPCSILMSILIPLTKVNISG